ncbi:FAD-dependent oxidoreductase [Hominifimenecus sp. rT4P-3]|uniref:FAD-dependent oxidoreductase n=1 Tax=Hominifimenecus sp. rT4P-3 TaxID=3242979 RepID=UPI003DA4C827
MNYLWDDIPEHRSYPTLKGTRKTDVLIIGGGMAGILCAYRLKEKGIDCLIAEGGQIGQGITRGTTAVLSAQHDKLYSDIKRQFGEAKARQYLDSNLRAVRRFQKLAEKYPCDWEEKPSYMYTLGKTDKLREEAKIVQKLGFPAEFVTDTPLPFPVSGAVRYPGMAQFHPLKFLYAMAEQLPIFEHTFIRKIQGTTAFADQGSIEAKKIIVATHFPILNRRGLYFMKLYQKRSFVVALEGAEDVKGTYVGTAEGSIYLRNYKDLLLVGGGDHRTGKKGGGFDAVHEFIHTHFPHAIERCAWAAQDCMSLDEIPYIGQYSPATPNLYVATGFNEWGMTSSMVASEVLADLICKGQSPYAPVYAPNRSMLRTQLFANMGETIVDYLFPTFRRCTHLGCGLKWNPYEHTWDCPCHGSRFSEQGGVMENPAMKDRFPGNSNLK